MSEINASDLVVEKERPAVSNSEPVFQIQRVYLKELTLEQPNSPQILLEQLQPIVNVNIGLDASPVPGGVFEVCVTATVTTKLEERTVFMVQAKQAGIFEIRNIPEDQIPSILGISCPQIVYPYLRAIVADIVTRAGFPAVQLSQINFQAMYESQQAEAAKNLVAQP